MKKVIIASDILNKQNSDLLNQIKMISANNPDELPRTFVTKLFEIYNNLPSDAITRLERLVDGVDGSRESNDQTVMNYAIVDLYEYIQDLIWSYGDMDEYY